jgi:hypothetical protein
MEPGFTTRFDEEWERAFYKSFFSVLPIGDESDPMGKHTTGREAV